MSVSSTSTSIFAAVSMRNSIFSKFSSMKLAGAISTRSKSFSEQTTDILGALCPFLRTRASTATRKPRASLTRNSGGSPGLIDQLLITGFQSKRRVSSSPVSSSSSSALASTASTASLTAFNAVCAIWRGAPSSRRALPMVPDSGPTASVMACRRGVSVAASLKSSSSWPGWPTTASSASYSALPCTSSAGTTPTLSSSIPAVLAAWRSDRRKPSGKPTPLTFASAAVRSAVAASRAAVSTAGSPGSAGAASKDCPASSATCARTASSAAISALTRAFASCTRFWA